VCTGAHVCMNVSVWMLTRVKQIITAAHRLAYLGFWKQGPRVERLRREARGTAGVEGMGAGFAGGGTWVQKL